jgi:hypothetical protein
MYHLIPQLKDINYTDSFLKLDNDFIIYGNHINLLKKLKESFKNKINLDICYIKKKSLRTPNQIIITKKETEVTSKLQNKEKEEAYYLEVNNDQIVMEGNSERALNYAVITLEQIIHQTDNKSIKTFKAFDEPVLKYRGLQLDISRGKVYKIDTIKKIVDIISFYKMNVFQLYIEHVYNFVKHENFCDESYAITPDYIIEIQDYCKSKYIEFMPNFQSFGHGRRVLLKKNYRYLSESDLYWTLSPAEDDTYNLLDDMYSEFLPIFESKIFNIGSDETYDLGEGKTKEWARREGKGKVYLEHILKVKNLAKKYDKKIMIFGDVILNYPELIDELPDDIIFLDWIYDPHEKYETPEIFGKYNKRFWVCPGTGSWNSLFPRLNGAIKNVKRLVRDGIDNGTEGMLLTDWGDHGHYTMLTPNFYTYALGAAVSWQGNSINNGQFEAALGILQYDNKDWVEIIRMFADIYYLPGMWSKHRSQCIISLFEEPLTGETLTGKYPTDKIKAHEKLPSDIDYIMDDEGHHPMRPIFRFTDDTINELEIQINKIKEKLNNVEDSLMKQEFTYIVDAFILIIKKIRLGRSIREKFNCEEITTDRLLDYHLEINKIKDEYKDLMLSFIEIWNEVAVESEIYITLTYFSNIIARFDYLQKWLWRQRKLIEQGDEPDYYLKTYNTCEYRSLPTY